MNQENEIKKEPIPGYGDHMTMKEFIEACRLYCFVDSDGIGNYAGIDFCTNKEISPSDVINNKYDNNYTHVMWFNK